MTEKTFEVQTLKEIAFDYLMFADFSRSMPCAEMMNQALHRIPWTDKDAAIEWAHRLTTNFETYRELLQRGEVEITWEADTEAEFEDFIRIGFPKGLIDSRTKETIWRQYRFQALHNVFAAIGDRLPIREISEYRQMAMTVSLAAHVENERIIDTAKQCMQRVFAKAA
jgi:hypothetical protein